MRFQGRQTRDDIATSIFGMRKASLPGFDETVRSKWRWLGRPHMLSAWDVNVGCQVVAGTEMSFDFRIKSFSQPQAATSLQLY